MHGLWVDKHGKHHAFELLPNGDNHGRARVSDRRDPHWSGDPDTVNYYFTRQVGTGTSKYKKDYHPDLNELVKIRAFTTRPEVEHMWFRGFSISVHVDTTGGASHSHTYQYSNVSPIPFYTPRKPLDLKYLAVLGDHQSLDDLKKGERKIFDQKGWDFPDNFDTSDTNYHFSGS